MNFLWNHFRMDAYTHCESFKEQSPPGKERFSFGTRFKIVPLTKLKSWTVEQKVNQNFHYRFEHSVWVGFVLAKISRRGATLWAQIAGRDNQTQVEWYANRLSRSYRFLVSLNKWVPIVSRSKSICERKCNETNGKRSCRYCHRRCSHQSTNENKTFFFSTINLACLLLLYRMVFLVSSSKWWNENGHRIGPICSLRYSRVKKSTSSSDLKHF